MLPAGNNYPSIIDHRLDSERDLYFCFLSLAQSVRVDLRVTCVHFYKYSRFYLWI